MNNQRNPMLMPALIGGGIAGFLSAVPIINIANCFCCLWIIAGGILSAYLLSKESTRTLTLGDGAIVGIFSGIVAAVVEFIISIPFQALNNKLMESVMRWVQENSGELPTGWDRLLERGATETAVTLSILGLLISVVLFSVMGALGGILGITLFKKKTPPSEGVIDVPKDKTSS
ncbi:MAG: hypothetical protein JW755_13130 [Candidatus Aminicenantes bacterium]|nr:hypothetical protein [Candidatus Aminicenantes bacterium]